MCVKGGDRVLNLNGQITSETICMYVEIIKIDSDLRSYCYIYIYIYV